MLRIKQGMPDLDAHAKPPEGLRSLYKRFQKASQSVLDESEEIIDFARGLSDSQLKLVDQIDYEVDNATARAAFNVFLNDGSSGNAQRAYEQGSPKTLSAYSIRAIGDLTILPALLPDTIQNELLNRLLHRDLSDCSHTTNVHFHHDVKYPSKGQSLFSLDPSRVDVIPPRDPSLHKCLSIRQFLTKKLRWMLLGGQYDWTKKRYPKETPPQFPSDIASLIHSLFPQMTAEAAITNLYSPGDTLSLHRDVSEECDNALVSISIGCDALFVLGLDDDDDDEESTGVVLRLRSGDAVLMSGASRYAWHGVPCVISNTCPEQLQDWPGKMGCDHNSNATSVAQDEVDWSGWMASKRINLNIRQMWPH